MIYGLHPALTLFSIPVIGRLERTCHHGYSVQLDPIGLLGQNQSSNIAGPHSTANSATLNQRSDSELEGYASHMILPTMRTMVNACASAIL
jgi:hypothetical protein